MFHVLWSFCVKATVIKHVSYLTLQLNRATLTFLKQAEASILNTKQLSLKRLGFKGGYLLKRKKKEMGGVQHIHLSY